MMATPQSKIVASFLNFLKTGRASPDLFAPDVFAETHVPGGHYRLDGKAELEEDLLRWTQTGYEVKVLDSEVTDKGFIVEFTQRTPTGELFEEMTWVKVRDGKVAEIRWYCTGVVHEHRHG